MPITAISWLPFSPIRRRILFEIDFEAFSIHGIWSLLTLACTFIATIFIDPWFKVWLVSWKQIAYSSNYCAWDQLNGCHIFWNLKRISMYLFTGSDELYLFMILLKILEEWQLVFYRMFCSKTRIIFLDGAFAFFLN